MRKGLFDEPGANIPSPSLQPTLVRMCDRMTSSIRVNTGAASYVNLWEERERDLIVMELLVNIMCTLNNVYNKDKNKIKPTIIIGFVQRRAWHYY